MHRIRMISRSVGDADSIHPAAPAVRLVVDRGMLGVTLDAEHQDIEVDAGDRIDLGGHVRLRIGTPGCEAELPLVPLLNSGASTAPLGLPCWLDTLSGNALV